MLHSDLHSFLTKVYLVIFNAFYIFKAFLKIFMGLTKFIDYKISKNFSVKWSNLKKMLSCVKRITRSLNIVCKNKTEVLFLQTIFRFLVTLFMKKLYA